MTARQAGALATILAATIVVSVTAGLPSAYIAADDFQWLAGGHTFSWRRLLYVTGGDRFYRPMADLWFASAASACGFTLSCHHLLLLGLHALNVSLMFVLASWLFRSLRTAWLAGLLFALNPAYTQAVVWLSGVTGVLCAFGYLGALTALTWSWRAQTGRDQRGRELLAVALFAAAVFSHEAAVTLPIAAAVMWRLFGPAEGAPRRIPLVGAGLVLAVFAAATIVANRRNALFTESGYTIGLHVADHALDYIASLYVGPSSTAAHVAIASALDWAADDRSGHPIWRRLAAPHDDPVSAVHGWQYVSLRLSARNRLFLGRRRGHCRWCRSPPPFETRAQRYRRRPLRGRRPVRRDSLHAVRDRVGSRAHPFVRRVANLGARPRPMRLTCATGRSTLRDHRMYWSIECTSSRWFAGSFATTRRRSRSMRSDRCRQRRLSPQRTQRTPRFNPIGHWMPAAVIQAD